MIKGNRPSDHDKPNILIIYPDQLRADAMGCDGNPVIKTPHFDRLAREGVKFEEAYTSFPLCTPFRSSLFTGKYNHSTGVFANHHPIPLNQEFLAERMKSSGYQTGYFGKWHLDGGAAPGFVPPGERRLGFNHFVGFNRGHYYQDSIFYRDSGRPYHCPRYEPDYQTDHLLQFLEHTQEANDTPFFGMICYGAPHFPFNMPDYLKTLYRPEEVPLGPTAGDVELQRRVTAELVSKGFPVASGVWGIGSGEGVSADDENAVRSYLAQYYGMIANVDHNVGVILNWLDAHGLAEDTVVVLLSDHGDMAGEHGYLCGTKKTPYRQVCRVPLLFRYPKRFPGGRRVPNLVDVSVDTMPTLLELCGIDIPESVQGVSYLPQLLGGSEPTRGEVYYEVNKEIAGPERFPIPERGVRTPEWLYTRTPDGPKLLIDLRNDPQERRNLVADPNHREQLALLELKLAAHMQATDDDWSAEAVFPPPGFLTHEEKTEKQKRLHAEAVVEY
jgi:arylsulfatase A-like enzyme